LSVSFSHVGIVVRNLDRAVAFYRDGLGFAVAEAWPVGSEFGTLMEIDGVALRSQFLRRDELAIELLCYDEPGFVGDGERRRVNQLGVNHLCFRVADVDDAATKVAEHGGVVLDHTRTTFGEGTGLMDFVYCTDPDGTRIELMHLPG
jgi:catechol 2,3-dioxygenase-like lactoylglutathione lyase family enzyme